MVFLASLYILYATSCFLVLVLLRRLGLMRDLSYPWLAMTMGAMFWPIIMVYGVFRAILRGE